MRHAVVATVIFILASAALYGVSRRSLRQPNSHGFYRFLACEFILGLVALNLFAGGGLPTQPHRWVSWFLLIASALLPLHAVRLLKRMGKPSAAREDQALFDFEKTSALVTSGAFRYIRHPMYTSLILLAWGNFLKEFSWIGLALVLAATALLFLTALREEQECLAYFGEAYRDYMRSTRRFVPFVL
ncbi:MAG TPA: isoprenylcysteine carboxylmethyltransferase family protein [Variovorax sp.]